MDKQMTISAFSDELAQVRTKKKEFLSQIERIVPARDLPGGPCKERRIT